MILLSHCSLLFSERKQAPYYLSSFFTDGLSIDPILSSFPISEII